MDHTALQTALSVARSGSIAEAARQLKLDPSSVSRTLAAVEASLGLRLFQRTTRQLSVTEEGAAYLQRIEPLLEEFDRAREKALHLKTRPEGTLRLTASVAFGTLCLLPNLPAFRAQYPGIKLDLALTDANVDLVAEGLDLAIRLAPSPKGDWISRKLTETRYLVCAAPGWAARHPLASPEALADQDCLRLTLPEHSEAWRFRPRTGPEFAVPIQGSFTLSNPIALKEAARLGMGPALLADWLAKDALKSGQLTQLFPEYQVTATSFETAAYALFPSRRYLPAKTRAAIDFLSANL